MENNNKYYKQSFKVNYFVILIMSLLITFGIKAQDFSTREEVYDYETGDEFHFSSKYLNIKNEGFEDITNLVIFGKYYSLQEDTVFYIQEVQNRRRDLINGNWEPWTYSYYTDTLLYTQLDTLIVLCSEPECYVYSNGSYCNGRQVNKSYTYIPDLMASISEKYVVGCGKTEFHYTSSYGNIDSTLVYYKKGDEEWGSPVIVGVGESSAQYNKLEIYPNPASSLININYNAPYYGIVYIYSIHGNLVKEINIIDNVNEIDISDLNPDIYFLKFDLEGKIVIKKLVKM